jgi:hypothetical protein
VTLLDSAVSANKATGGDGSFNAGITGGPGGDAEAGIIQFSQALSLQRSTVAGNIAVAGAGERGSPSGGAGGKVEGAGLASAGGTLTVSAGTISGNRATGGAGGGASSGTGGNGGLAAGGGIFTKTGGTLVNVTVAGNQLVPGARGDSIAGPNGMAGDAFGGGIDEAGITSTTLTLAGVTLAGNSAGAGHGGNLNRTAGALAASSTIVASGTAAGDSNCSTGAVTMDGGHNLESTTPSQCGLSTGMQDLIGTDPLLQSLADNGGPTRTMALGGSSPALGAGGACTDPSNANQPLTVDQRGRPRPVACDIGAFQAQRPAGKALPQVTGTPATGQVLSCSQGDWSGDLPLTFGYSWLRDGAPIAGAVAPQYTVGADAGHRISCKVTASNAYGTASQVSADLLIPVVVPPDTTPPAISAFSVKPSAFVAARSGPTVAAVHTGAVVAYTLSEAASTAWSVDRKTIGVRRGGRCVAGKPKRGKKRCTRWVHQPGGFRRGGLVGTNSFRFTGRLGGKRLRPASYRLVAVATDAAGNRSKPARRPFRIKR